jgi:hypothetical protein
VDLLLPLLSGIFRYLVSARPVYLESRVLQILLSMDLLKPPVILSGMSELLATNLEIRLKNQLAMFVCLNYWLQIHKQATAARFL